jgi:hypothetical protein
MAVEEVIKDQFSDEEYMVGDNSEAAYVPDGEDPMKSVMDLDSASVEVALKNRLKGEAFEALPVLKKENDALKFELGNALKTIEAKKTNTDISPSVFSNIDIKTGSLGEFTKSVGESFMNVAKAVPDKIDAIFEDPEKRKNVIRGLNILNESSGIKPIGQAKSPLGSIASGLLKAEASFTAEDIARLKAQKKEPRRYPSPNETLLTETFGAYKKADKDKLKEFVPISTRYNLVKKIALDGNELPTGILNKTFSELKAFLAEVPGGEQLYNSLSEKFSSEGYGADGDPRKMELDDQVIFNNLFQAATYQQVVKQVKELYPVSNKDIDTLLKTKGDIGSKPEALIKLIAAEMATKEIYMGSRNLATLYFKNDDLDFEQKSILGSEKIIAEKLRKENKVTNSSIEKLFGKGSAESVTDAGYITAYYYQSLQADITKSGVDPFTVFVTAKKQEEKEIDDIIKKNQ